MPESPSESAAHPCSAWALIDWVYWPSMLAYLWLWKAQGLAVFGNLLMFWQWVVAVVLVALLLLVLMAGRPMRLPSPATGLRKVVMNLGSSTLLLCCVALGEFSLGVAVLLQLLAGALIRALSTR